MKSCFFVLQVEYNFAIQIQNLRLNAPKPMRAARINLIKAISTKKITAAIAAAYCSFEIFLKGTIHAQTYHFISGKVDKAWKNYEVTKTTKKIIL